MNIENNTQQVGQTETCAKEVADAMVGYLGPYQRQNTVHESYAWGNNLRIRTGIFSPENTARLDVGNLEIYCEKHTQADSVSNFSYYIAGDGNRNNHQPITALTRFVYDHVFEFALGHAPARWTAFAMVRNPRLGHASPFHFLSEEIVEMICRRTLPGNG